MSFDLDPVLYSQQWNLHDVDSIIKRGFARSNIQGAYINGDVVEDFSAKHSMCENITSSVAAYINQVIVTESKVTSNDSISNNISVVKGSSQVKVKFGNVEFYVDASSGSGNIDFYSVTLGVNTRIAYLDKSGNFHLKGEFITFDTTV